MKALSYCLALIVFLSSLAANIALAKRNDQLVWQLNAKEATRSVSVGDHLPAMVGNANDDLPKTVDVNVPGIATVVLVLSPLCHFCKQNWPQWDSLIESSKPGSPRFVILNIGPPMTADYIREHRLEGKIILNTVSQETVDAYKLHVTPETLVIDQSGTVRGDWQGVLSDESKRDLAKALSTLYAAKS